MKLDNVKDKIEAAGRAGVNEVEELARKKTDVPVWAIVVAALAVLVIFVAAVVG